MCIQKDPQLHKPTRASRDVGFSCPVKVLNGRADRLGSRSVTFAHCVLICRDLYIALQCERSKWNQRTLLISSLLKKANRRAWRREVIYREDAPSGSDAGDAIPSCLVTVSTTHFSRSFCIQVVATIIGSVSFRCIHSLIHSRF